MVNGSDPGGLFTGEEVPEGRMWGPTAPLVRAS
jgi:hypothetical protein